MSMSPLTPGRPATPASGQGPSGDQSPGGHLPVTSQTPQSPRVSLPLVNINPRLDKPTAVDGKSPAGTPSPLEKALLRSCNEFEKWAPASESAAATRDRFILGLNAAAATGDTRELLPPLPDAPVALREAQACLKKVLEDELQPLLGELQTAVRESIAQTSTLMAIKAKEVESEGALLSKPGDQLVKAKQVLDGMIKLKTQLEGTQGFLLTGRRENLHQLVAALRDATFAPASVIAPFKALIQAKQRMSGAINAVRGQVKVPLASQISPPEIQLDLSGLSLTPRRSQARHNSRLSRK